MLPFQCYASTRVIPNWKQGTSWGVQQEAKSEHLDNWVRQARNLINRRKSALLRLPDLPQPLPFTIMGSPSKPQRPYVLNRLHGIYLRGYSLRANEKTIHVHQPAARRRGPACPEKDRS